MVDMIDPDHIKGVTSAVKTPLYRRALLGLGGAAVAYYSARVLGTTIAGDCVAVAATAWIAGQVAIQHKRAIGATGNNGRKRSSQTVGQDAQFASVERLIQMANSPGLVIGQRDASPKSKRGEPVTSTSPLLKYELEAHAMTVAPARSGKGLLINTNLLSPAGAWNGPVLAVDPKLENYCISAKLRMQQGRRVALLDPFAVVDGLAKSRPDCKLDDIAKSDRFNFMDLVQRGDEGSVQVLEKMSIALVPATKGGQGNEHFDSLTRDYIQTGSIWVSETAGLSVIDAGEAEGVVTTGAVAAPQWIEGGFLYLDMKAGSVVGKVSAVDGNGGIVTYEMADPNGPFAIDAQTGVIKVKTWPDAMYSDNIGVMANSDAGGMAFAMLRHQLTARDRTIPAIYAVLNNAPRRALCKSWLHNPHVAWGMALSAGALFGEMADEEFSGVKSGMARALKWASTPQMARHLSESTFDVFDLLEDRLDIFLGAPATQTTTLSAWYRLWVTLPALLVEMRRPKRRILAVLDEFPALGRIEVVPTAFRALPGLGISFWAITQDLHALEQVYGAEDAHSMLANAELFQIFEVARNDWKTAEMISKTLGEVYDEQTTYSSNSGSSARVGEIIGTGSKGTATNTTLVKGFLMTPDQLVRMESGEMIAMIRFREGEKRPVRCFQAKYFERPETKDLATLNPYYIPKKKAA